MPGDMSTTGNPEGTTKQGWQTAANMIIPRPVASPVSLGSVTDFLQSCLEHPVIGKELPQSMKKALLFFKG